MNCFKRSDFFVIHESMFSAHRTDTHQSDVGLVCSKTKAESHVGINACSQRLVDTYLKWGAWERIFKSVHYGIGVKV